MRKIQGTPVLVLMDIKEAFFRITLVPESTNLSLFLMDLNTKTNELTAKVGPDTKLVTIRSLVSIMGFLQSPSFLNLCLDSLTNDIKDKILQYFLKYMRYLDDLQSGLVAEEILELQSQVDLDAEDLGKKCDDGDCCSQEGEDLQPLHGAVINPDLLGEPTPPDEKMCTRHLLKADFDKKVLHRLVLRAATLKAALISASMPSKGATTSLHQHFQHELVNEGIKSTPKYF